MLLAQQVREEGNLDLTLNLLNRHRPAPGEADLRGWEWRYLWNLCQSDEVATFATNSAGYRSLGDFSGRHSAQRRRIGSLRGLL